MSTTTIELYEGRNFTVTSGFVKPCHFVEASMVSGAFATFCDDPQSREQVAGLMRFLGAYMRRWLPVDERQDQWIWIEPSPKSYRRYWVSVRAEKTMPTEIERAPWAPRWEPSELLPPSRRRPELASATLPKTGTES